jgi:hypothetical protein
VGLALLQRTIYIAVQHNNNRGPACERRAKDRIPQAKRVDAEVYYERDIFPPSCRRAGARYVP